VTGPGPSGEPNGMTVGSFISLSLEPPLVAFWTKGSSSGEALGGAFLKAAEKHNRPEQPESDVELCSLSALVFGQGSARRG
jgi:hypothetical protein